MKQKEREAFERCGCTVTVSLCPIHMAAHEMVEILSSLASAHSEHEACNVPACLVCSANRILARLEPLDLQKHLDNPEREA